MSSAIPHEELPILEALVNIRNRLTALKKDSGEYIKPQDVMDIYKAVIKQVTRLNAVRDEHDMAEAAAASTSSSAAPPPPAADSSGTEGSFISPSPSTTGVSANDLNNSSSSLKATHGSIGSTGTNAGTNSSSSSQPIGEHTKAASSQQESHAYADSLPKYNRVDTTLNDVFALLSLFFLTIGRSRETPAAFSQLACMKQFFDHLSESGIYTEADLEPFSKRLAELRAMIRKDAEQGKHPPALTKLMMRKLEGCEKLLASLQGTLKVLSVELVPIHQRLIAVRRQIVAAAAKPKLPRAEIKQLQEELRRIDSKRVDGKFLGPGGSSVPAGQAILVGILEECFEICHEINVRNDEVPMTLQPIYDRLSEIKAQLEHLVLTHRWTLRETDLWNYQVTLKEIDRLRVNGKFVDNEGKQPEGQPVLLYLLRRCYGLIYRLVASSEPISEELMPISNKLSTISKCLKEVSKYGGPYTMRDLYPYRLALHQIDAMRTNIKDKDFNDTGVKKWLGRDGSIPEGQAILRAQFEEVEQTIQEMLNQEEEDDDEEGSDGEWEAGSSAASASGAVTDSSVSQASVSEYGSRIFGLGAGGTGVAGTGSSTPASPAPGFSPSGFGIAPGIGPGISSSASPMGIGIGATGAAHGGAAWGGFNSHGVTASLIGAGAGGGSGGVKGGHESPAAASVSADVSTSGASPSFLATSPSPLMRCPLGQNHHMPPLDLGQNKLAGAAASGETSAAAASATLAAALPPGQHPSPSGPGAGSTPSVPEQQASAPAPEEPKSGLAVVGPGGNILERLPAEPPVVVPAREQLHAAGKQQHYNATAHVKAADGKGLGATMGLGSGAGTGTSIEVDKVGAGAAAGTAAPSGTEQLAHSLKSVDLHENGHTDA